MAQNIDIAGAQYSAVPAIQVPKHGGGTASFMDTSDANAGASDIMSGKTAYVNGAKVTGTASGGYQVGIISSATSASMQTAVFDGLLGEPVAFAAYGSPNGTSTTYYPYTSNTTNYWVASWTYGGTTNNCILWTKANSNYPCIYDNRSQLTFTYSSGTLTLNTGASNVRFFGQNTSASGNHYELVYVY